MRQGLLHRALPTNAMAIVAQELGV